MHPSASPSSVLLVGPPNSGKTTLFNWLTHSRFRAVNYPGSTVDCLKGQSHPSFGPSFGVVDSPGIYGLNPESADEEITVKLVNFDDSMGRIEAAVICVDATQIERHLPLVLKLKHLGWPISVALTMQDLAKSSGHHVDRTELEKVLQAPVVEVDGRTGAGVDILVGRLRELSALSHQQINQLKGRPALKPEDANKVVADWMGRVRKVELAQRTPAQVTARIDDFLLHPVWGIFGFLAVMVGIFTAVFWLADPMMGLVDESISAFTELLHRTIQPGLARDFLVDGVISSFGAVVVFAPQILILFFLLSLLEDSGYLARAATLIDRPLSFLGLSGRAFVPLLSGYACAVPAIMAVRTMRAKRERWLAISIIPLLSCSARLPVYALLLAYLFQDRPAWQAGLVLTVIYLGSAVVGAGAAVLFNRILKDKAPTTFMMELPFYRRPQMFPAVRHAVARTRTYLRRAGPVIFTLALVLWFGTNFPSQNPKESYIGQLGQAIEPVFKPMGVDWRVGVGLLSAFAAREVFVSAVALVFDITDSGEESGLRDSLLKKMHEARFEDGQAVFTASSILGLIIFFMIALQCSSTVAVVARETGSWRFALWQLLVLNLAAYVIAVSVVQTARAMGVG